MQLTWSEVDGKEYRARDTCPRCKETADLKMRQFGATQHPVFGRVRLWESICASCASKTR